MLSSVMVRVSVLASKRNFSQIKDLSDSIAIWMPFESTSVPANSRES